MSKLKTQNRTFHLLQKADILTCYEQPAWFDEMGEDHDAGMGAFDLVELNRSMTL